MALIGLDVGTTGVKAVAYTKDGIAVASEYREYATINERPGWFELDPLVIWRCAKEILSIAAEKCGGDIQAITVSSIGESFVCFDKDDNVLTNSILYLDHRGKELFQEFIDQFGLNYVRGILGPKVTYAQSLHRLRLLGRDKPEVFCKIKKICFMSDFILHMLGADHCCDYTIAQTTSCFNMAQRQWHKAFCDWAGVDTELLPVPVPTGTQIGVIRPSVAKLLGVREDVRLVIGPYDHVASIIGTGLKRSGEVFNAIGTVDMMMTFTDCIETARAAFERDGLLYSMHYKPGVYMIDPGTQYAGGSMLKWFRDHFAALDKYLCEKAGKNFYSEYERRIPKEPTNLIIAGDFSGAAGGCVLNLTLATNNETIYRAFLEGETYLARARYERIRNAGLPVDTIITVGGGARSDTLMQIRADNFKVPVSTISCPEPGTLGNALLGGVASGWFASVSEAVKEFVRTEKTFYPEPKNVKIYDRHFEKFKESSEYYLCREHVMNGN